MASTYLSKTLGTATNRKKWTFSAWVKKARHQASIDEAIFSSYAEATTSYYSRLADNGTSRFEFTEYNGSGYAINLRPTQRHRLIDRYVSEEEFEQYKTIGQELGIPHIESGPLVRSSYHAKDSFASV